MGLGASMFLIALGLILALAVEVDVGPLDIQTIGWILVLVGIVGIALFFTVWKPRRKVLNPDEAASAPRRVTIDERYDEQDPTTVATELVEAADVLAARFDGVAGVQWHRTSERSDGSVFTVDSFARYLLHDPIHHLRDVGEPFDPV